jgi:hypothetical protein
MQMTCDEHPEDHSYRKQLAAGHSLADILTRHRNSSRREPDQRKKVGQIRKRDPPQAMFRRPPPPHEQRSGATPDSEPIAGPSRITESTSADLSPDGRVGGTELSDVAAPVHESKGLKGMVAGVFEDK